MNSHEYQHLQDHDTEASDRHAEPTLLDPRSYESPDGDILPLDILSEPVQDRFDNSEYMMTRVPLGEVLGPRDRMIQKALAEQAFSRSRDEQQELKNDRLDVATALQLLHKEAGFYAHSNEEKNSMQAVVGRSEAGYPVIRYLDEVEYHQRKAATDDPVRALRSIAQNFESYAVEAHNEVGFSQFFTEEVARRPVNMNQKLSQNFTRDDLVQSDALRRTLTSLARLREVDAFVEEKGENPLGVKSGIDSLKGDARDKRIFELLDTMQLGRLMNLNSRMIREENKRFEYWKSTLEQARMRGSIRQQVDTSLEKLNKLRPV